MAVDTIKVGQIARTMIGLLNRELVIAKTVWNDAVGGDEFTGALNDTVTVRIPARGQPARTRVLRAGTPITNDDLVERSIPVTLDTDVYRGVAITDEELTLDITSFAEQVLRPQTQAVAEGIEDVLADAIENSPFDASIAFDPIDPFTSIIQARQALNDRNVPRGSRYLLVGSEVESAILTSDRIAFAFPSSAGEDAYRDAEMGRIGGFTVVGSNGIPSNRAYAYHRTAWILATRAPAVPDGVAFGQGISLDGIAARWIKDYDYVNTTDRSLVNTWMGVGTVTDAQSDPAFVRAVELVLAGS